jgi:hypothetical protein
MAFLDRRITRGGSPRSLTALSGSESGASVRSSWSRRVMPAPAGWRRSAPSAGPCVRQAAARRGEQPVDDHVATSDAVVDQFGFALGTDHEQRRQFALRDAFGELDEHAHPVVERAQRAPVRAVAVDRVAES